MKNQRTCIACRKKCDIASLQRISLNKSSVITIDEGKKTCGRGAYICKNKECFEKAIKTSALNRAYKQQISKEAYEKLKSRSEEFGK